MAKALRTWMSRSSKKDDPANEGEVIVDINIDKNKKNQDPSYLFLRVTKKLTARELKKAMKKTKREVQLAERLENQYQWRCSARRSSRLRNMRTIRKI